MAEKKQELKFEFKPVMPVHNIKYMGRKHDKWVQEETYSVYIQHMNDNRYAVFSAIWNDADPGLTVYADEECLRHAWDIDILYVPRTIKITIDPVTGMEVPSP